MAAALLAVGLGAFPTPTHTAPAAAAASPTARYEPVGPCRLVDQRTGLGIDRIDAGSIRTDLAASRCEIPADATSILTTITIVRPSATGFTVARPTGAATPQVAHLNHRPGEIRANGALVQVDAGRRVTFVRSDGTASGRLVVDVVGAFVPAESAAAGRFVAPATASRLLDTRLGSGGIDQSGVRVRGGTTIRVPLPDHVPPDATALAVTAVMVRNLDEGFLTLHPAGSDRPIASSLNADAPGQVRSGATVVPVTSDGFDVFVSADAHIVLDTTGWFTGPSAEESTDGLFVAATPRRLTDTRPSPDPIHPDGTIEVGVPAPDALAYSSAMTSITMIRSDRQGFITTHPARVDRGETSTGNTQAGELVAQFSITPISSAGLAVYSSTRVDVTVDLFGWFAGPAATTDGSGPAANAAPRQRVLTIGDSSHAGIERNGAFGALRGARYEVRGESCRRLVKPSCDLRGTGAPPTALETLRSTPYGAYDVLVIQGGYNDQMPRYARDVDEIFAAAVSIGVRRVVWLTHSREFRSDVGGATSFQVYQGHNDVLRALGTRPDVIVVEWGSLVRQRPGHVYPDGIHLRRAGGFAAADTISRSVAHATGQPCPMPESPGAAPLDPCPNPGTRPPVDPAGLYDLGERLVPCSIEGPRRETICRWDHPAS